MGITTSVKDTRRPALAQMKLSILSLLGARPRLSHGATHSTGWNRGGRLEVGERDLTRQPLGRTRGCESIMPRSRWKIGHDIHRSAYLSPSWSARNRYIVALYAHSSDPQPIETQRCRASRSWPSSLWGSRCLCAEGKLHGARQ